MTSINHFNKVKLGNVNFNENTTSDNTKTNTKNTSISQLLQALAKSISNIDNTPTLTEQQKTDMKAVADYIKDNPNAKPETDSTLKNLLAKLPEGTKVEDCVKPQSTDNTQSSELTEQQRTDMKAVADYIKDNPNAKPETDSTLKNLLAKLPEGTKVEDCVKPETEDDNTEDNTIEANATDSAEAPQLTEQQEKDMKAVADYLRTNPYAKPETDNTLKGLLDKLPQGTTIALATKGK